MTTARIYLDVAVSGPLADHNADEDVKVWLDGVQRDLAQMGVNKLQSFEMDRTGRGTGHYQSELVTSRLANSDILLHDPVVYGPWLEGVSERNRSTRFKGYRLWRKTQQLLNQEATAVAEERLPELIDKLGGGEA